MNPRPMRGVKVTKPLTDFPYLASPKIDGMRMWVKDGIVLSKTGKPIPNRMVQRLFGHLEGADGEGTVGPAHSEGPDDDVFDRSRGPIMRKDCDADFQFWIFDRWDMPDRSAQERYLLTLKFTGEVGVTIVHQRRAINQGEVDRYLEEYLDDGYEGAMLRRADGIYKYGQSTENEGYLLKLKPMEDSEAVILGYVEQRENTNVATKDELGYTKRSSAKAGKIGKDTLGALVVRDIHTGVEFEVGNGPGLTHQRRDALWADRENLPGQIVTYTYQAIGSKDKPRLPQLKGFRDPMDISELAGL